MILEETKQMLKLMDKNPRLLLLLIPIISLIMHFPIFKLDLIGMHVWRQTQTQTVIQNFYEEDFNILNSRFNDNAHTDRIVRMEFPVMQWIFACFYKVFGDHVVISRVLTFIIGLFSVYGFYYLIKNIFKSKFMAAVGAWCFNFSPVFYYYTVNPLPDNFALCCVIWSTAFFFRWKDDQKMINFILFTFFLCLASLAKLPFILYSCFFFIFILIDLKRNRLKNLFSYILLSFLFLIIIVPVFLWYIWVIPTWGGNGIVKGIFDNPLPAEEIWRIIYGTLTSRLIELLINYGSFLFFIAGFYFLFKNKEHKKVYFPLFLIWGITLGLYFVFEMNMITLVHDYYLFPFLPAIFILVAYGAYHLYIYPNLYYKYVVMGLLCILPFTAYLRAQSRWNIQSPGFNVDFYNYKNELRNLVPDNAYCIAGNDDSHFILLYYIGKKGWAFDHDNLTADKLQYYMNMGAQYLYLDSDLDKLEGIRAHLGEKIFDKGAVRVYRLK